MQLSVAGVPAGGTTPAGRSPRRVQRWWPAVPPAVALAVAGAGYLAGWHGVDVAASMHRVLVWRSSGYVAWDNSWYGGQWTLSYSPVFAPVASTLGLTALGLLSAATAAAAFERIVTPRFGTAGRAAAVVVAVGTVVQTAIGQYPYLSGEAVGLCALWAASRRRWPLAGLLAVVAAALSPLAGAFVALAGLSWGLARHREMAWPARAAAASLLVGGLAPTLVTTVMFPGEGNMPYSGVDCLIEVVIAAGLLALTPRPERTLRTGIGLYIVVLAGSYLVPSPVGVNAGRLEDVMALPLATALLWGRRRLLLVAVALPLAWSGWGQIADAVVTIPGEASAHQAFYRPLVSWLREADPAGRSGRVEVVPTQSHSESAWVAAVAPLARGWERQTDTTVNPIFYRPGALDAATYLAWLRSNGVRWVALPSGPLDFAATGEARLLRAGVPGLRPLWQDADWRVWEVTGSPGIVSGPARVLGVAPSSVRLELSKAASVVVRVRWNRDWTVAAGSACVTRSAAGWVRVDAAEAGQVTIRVSLTGARCRSG